MYQVLTTSQLRPEASVSKHTLKAGAGWCWEQGPWGFKVEEEWVLKCPQQMLGPP